MAECLLSPGPADRVHERSVRTVAFGLILGLCVCDRDKLLREVSPPLERFKDLGCLTESGWISSAIGRVLLLLVFDGDSRPRLAKRCEIICDGQGPGLTIILQVI